jgi:hypothetical protein
VTFTIVVSQLYEIIPPNQGNVLRSISDTTKPEHYQISISTDQEYYGKIDYVLVSVTLISGTTRLYVTSNDTLQATPDQNMWSSTTWPGNVILIKRNDPLFRGGDWSICKCLSCLRFSN